MVSMDYPVLIVFAACVAAALGTAASPFTTSTPQQFHTTPLEPENQGTTNNTLPPKNLTNLGPDEFYKWLNGIGKKESSTQDIGSTVKPIVLSNTSEGLAEPASTQQPTEQSTDTEIVDIGPEVSTESISEVESFFNKLNRVKPTSAESGNDSQETTEADNTTTGEALLEQDIETPSTVSPKTDDDAEWLRKVFEEATRAESSAETGNPETVADSSPQNRPWTEKPEPSGNDDRRKHHKFNLPPPDKFYEWLSSRHLKSKPEHVKEDQSETRSKVSSDEFMTTKLIIVSVSVACGMLGIFAIILAAYVIYKKQQLKKSASLNDPRKADDKGVFNSGYTDVFHGIPTNNDIWKNLEMLSVNTPSVLPDIHPKV